MRGSFKGEPYNEVIWRKAVLYPQKSGNLVLDPLTLNLTLSLPSNRRDLFGRRILTQSQKTITTGKKLIKVKDLPEKNKPDNFSGAVGKFDFDLILNKDVLKASESFQAKIKVRGKGNLNLFNLPSINVPNTLEVYEPEHDEKVKVTLSGIQGTVEDSYTIVPQFQGKYPIPSIEFTYFDPKLENYKTLFSQELIVDVFEGPTSGLPSVNNNLSKSKNSIVPNDSSFRFIKLDTKLQQKNQKIFWRSYLFWTLLFIPIFLIITSILIKKYVLNKTEDLIIRKQKRAQQLAKRYLSSAKKVIQDQTRFYEALERALHNYLKAKLKIETTELSKSKIQKLLNDKGIDKQISSEYVEVIENCERARYAPGSSINTEEDLKKSGELISKIDRQL